MSFKTFYDSSAPADFEGDYVTVIAVGDKLVNHSFDDQPSERKGSMLSWHHQGKLHRDGDKPAIIHHEQFGTTILKIERIWYKNGQKHRDGDKPAKMDIRKIIISNTGAVRIHLNFEYRKNGNLEREGDQPAFIEKIKSYKSDKSIEKYSITEHFYKKHKIHRDGDKPAVKLTVFVSTPSGLIKKTESKKYYKHDILHREKDKPAVIDITRSKMNGNISHLEKRYIVEGVTHRDDDKPAYLLYKANSNGDLIVKQFIFYKDGIVHRDGDEPAYIKDTYKNNILVHAKHGKISRNSAPAVCFTSKPYLLEKEELSYSFFENDIEIKDKSLIKTFLIKEYLNYDSSYSDIDLNDFPLQQIESLLSAVSGILYNRNIPLEELAYIRRTFF